MANKKVILHNPSDSTEEWYPMSTDDNIYSSDGRSVKDKYIAYTTQSSASQSINILLNTIYPIGSVRLSFNDGETSFMGGTWVKIQDKFLLGAGTKIVGSTGGEENHTLTVDEIPSHNHTIWRSGNGGGAWTGMAGSPTNEYSHWTSAVIGNTGGGQAHNNMPPYIVVFIYRRTA